MSKQINDIKGELLHKGTSAQRALEAHGMGKAELVIVGGAAIVGVGLLFYYVPSIKAWFQSLIDGIGSAVGTGAGEAASVAVTDTATGVTVSANNFLGTTLENTEKTLGLPSWQTAMEQLATQNYIEGKTPEQNAVSVWNQLTTNNSLNPNDNPLIASVEQQYQKLTTTPQQQQQQALSTVWESVPTVALGPFYWAAKML